MTLNNLVSTAFGTKTIFTVLDSDQTQLIKFYSGGQTQLSTDLLAKTVESWSIESATSVIVTLSAS